MSEKKSVSNLLNFLGRFRIRLALAFLFVGLIPLLAVGWISMRVAEGSLRQTTLERDQTLLDAVTHGVEWFVQGRLDQLAQAAQQPRVQTLDSEGAGKALRETSARLPFFDGLFLYNSSGTVVARAGGLARTMQQRPELEKRILHSSKYLEMISASGTASLARSHPDPEWRGKLLVLTVPVTDFLNPECKKGVLTGVAAIEGSEFQQILEAFRPEPQEYLCILSGSGEILSQTGTGLAEDAISFKLGIVASISETLGGVHTVEYLNGSRPDLLSVRYSPVIGGWLLSGRPTEKAFRMLYRLRETFLVAVFLMLVLIFAAVLLLSSNLSKPILDLTFGLHELREGRYSHRVRFDADDELGKAGQALNELASFLQRRFLIGSLWERFRSGNSAASVEKSDKDIN